MDNTDGLASLVKNYFDALFAQGASTYEPVVEKLNRRVSDNDNAALLRPFSPEKFKAEQGA